MTAFSSTFMKMKFINFYEDEVYQTLFKMLNILNLSLDTNILICDDLLTLDFGLYS